MSRFHCVWGDSYWSVRIDLRTIRIHEWDWVITIRLEFIRTLDRNKGDVCTFWSKQKAYRNPPVCQNVINHKFRVLPKSLILFWCCRHPSCPCCFWGSRIYLCSPNAINSILCFGIFLEILCVMRFESDFYSIPHDYMPPIDSLCFLQNEFSYEVRLSEWNPKRFTIWHSLLILRTGIGQNLVYNQ